PHISESEARKVFSDLIAQRCCYDKSVIKDMVLQKMTSSNVYHYTLETYIETRMTSWEQEPYSGQYVDSPANGMPPSPWEIHCHPNQMFHDEIHLMEVPHTATIVTCTACGCQGCVRCFNCLGRGFKRCISCHGSGNVMKLTDSRGPRHMDSCWRCRGTGRKRCPSCGGDGRVACKTCLGFKYLKCFINIRIEYSNNSVEHMINRSQLLNEALKEVKGYQVFQQTQPRVWPIVNHPEEEICCMSDALLSEHIKTFNSYARIIMQRQKLKMIPVTECTYAWKQESIKFWIYGKDNQLHAPNFPQKYCCGCVVV
ncbi:hypothetical protein HELRODRAFT_63547, partial [Helobdella robusta]|uniref:CR-type domain-containing protein n=1 Tax=Helobdella robusta TaxID=6412 RepID=T1FXH2_HELRO